MKKLFTLAVAALCAASVNAQDFIFQSGSDYATKGTATATLANGTTETVEWVQLWAGGPRFATEDVEKEMTWTEAAKTGEEYVWGANWRTPKAEEVEE